MTPLLRSGREITYIFLNIKITQLLQYKYGSKRSKAGGDLCLAGYGTVPKLQSRT